MSRIVTFGEIMMRLEPPGYARLVQTDSFGVVFGGAEANVALGLASLGDDAAFVTRLPAHAMGDAAVNSLRRYGVDTRHIVRGGSRVGIYFNEKGADLRGGIIIKPQGRDYWLYSRLPIENTSDLTGWDMFDPRNA